MADDGCYLYCILDDRVDKSLGKVGLLDAEVHGLSYKDVTALVSPIQFKEIDTNLDNILAHQRVVELSRGMGTTLPVKFGIIFRNEGGVSSLLSKSYDDYRAKLTRLKDKDEFGIKVILNDVGLKRIRTEVANESRDIGKIRKDVTKAKRGTSYLLNIKMEEALRNETYRKIDSVSREIHRELSEASVDNVPLKSEHDQIILNAAYLVDRVDAQKFQKKVEATRKAFEKEGLVIHVSGPWAPYSFC